LNNSRCGQQQKNSGGDSIMLMVKGGGGDLLLAKRSFCKSAISGVSQQECTATGAFFFVRTCSVEDVALLGHFTTSLLEQWTSAAGSCQELSTIYLLEQCAGLAADATSSCKVVGSVCRML
jgi:hypothetical protein